MPAKAIIQVRRDTAANWTSTNPTLAAGEIGFESNTNKFKFGTGSTAWNSLAYTTAGVAVSTTAPSSPSAGDIWYNSTDGTAYIYYDNFWVDLNPGITGPAGKFTVSATAPSSPETGDGWFNSTTARLFIYYDDFWIEATSNYIGPTGDTGVLVQDEEPTNTEVLWLDSDDFGNPTTLPLGGSTGQVLAKATGDDYNTEWVSPFGPSSAQTIDDKGSNYSLTSADAGKLITNSGAITITVEGLAAGQQVDFLQTNASQITFVAGSGVTLNSKGGNLKTAAQYSPAAIKCTATNTYVLVGDLGA
jgi:hypothetical protein